MLSKHKRSSDAAEQWKNDLMMELQEEAKHLKEQRIHDKEYMDKLWEEYLDNKF